MAITQDPGIFWYFPATAAEATQLFSGTLVAAPNAIWNFQDATGDFRDSVGDVHLLRNGRGQQRFGPTSRLCQNQLDLDSDQSYNIVSASLPDLNTTSMTVLVVEALPGPATGARSTTNIGPGIAHSNNVEMTFSSTRLFGVSDGTNTGVAGTDHGLKMMVNVLRYNSTAGTTDVFADGDKISKTFVRPVAASKGVWFGASYANSPLIYRAWACAWYGANAELTDSQIQSIIMRIKGQGPAVVTQDPVNRKFFPTSQAEWTSLLASTNLRNPTFGWVCQDSSTVALSPVFGGLNLVSEGVRQTAGSFSTGSIRNAAWTKADGWFSTSSLLPEMSSSSGLFVVCMRTMSTASLSTTLELGVTAVIAQAANGFPRIVASGGSNVTGVRSLIGRTQYVALQVNRATTTMLLKTEDEVITTPAVNMSGKQIFITGGTAGNGDVQYLAAYLWTGSLAEMTPDQLKTLFDRLQNGPPSYLSFDATGTFSDASTLDVTSQATWTSSDPNAYVLGSNTASGTVAWPGRVYGQNVTLTASVGAVAGSGTVMIIAADSSSFGSPYGIKFPSQDDHWKALGLSPFGSYWGLQEPSGVLPLSSGSTQITMRPQQASITFNQGLSGHVRGGMTVTTAGQLASLRTPSYPFNNAQMNSGVAILANVRIRDLTTRTLFGQTSGTLTRDGLTVMDMLVKVTSGTNGANIFLAYSGSNTFGTFKYDDGNFHPILMVYDPANSRIKTYTDLEVITGSYGGMLGTGSNALGFGWIGENSNGTVTSDFNYFAVATGSIAASLSDDGKASQFLKRFGWQPRWNWTRDASAYLGVPASFREWQELITGSVAMAPPSNLWLCQEATGNLIDTFGTANLQPFNSPHYNSSVLNWNRHSVNTLQVATAGAAQCFFTTGNSDISTASRAVFMLLTVSGSLPGNFNILELGGEDSTGAYVTGSYFGASVNSTRQPGTVPFVSQQVYPVMVISNFTAKTLKVYTNGEIISPLWGVGPAPAGTGIDVGAFFTPSATVQYLYIAQWQNSAAELTDAQVRAMFSMMGWAPAW